MNKYALIQIVSFSKSIDMINELINLENILKLEKFNNDDVKFKKNLNVNLIKKIEDNLFY